MCNCQKAQSLRISRHQGGYLTMNEPILTSEEAKNPGPVRVK